MVNPLNITTADCEDYHNPAPVRSPDPGNPPTPQSSISSHIASGTNPDANPSLDMATAISQFMEERTAGPCGRVEKISEKLVPLRARRDRSTWTVRYFLWIRDQKDRVAASTKGTCNDDSEAHENPWKPCQPSEDAKEWNGIKGIDSAPPGADLDCSATPSVTDDPTVADEERTE